MSKTAADLTGKEVREVWDWRLSRAQPINFNSGDTWVCKIIANDASDPFWENFPEARIEVTPSGNTRKVLEAHDTGIPTVKNGIRDMHDSEAVAACHAWAYSVRDKYSREHLELRKPVVALINNANAQAQRLNDERMNALAAGDVRLANEKLGEYQEHLRIANAEIKKAATDLNKVIGGAA